MCTQFMSSTYRSTFWHFQNVADFNKEAVNFFYVFCTDEESKKLESLHELKMTDMEYKFVGDQRSDRKMICEVFIDRKWKKTMTRKRKDLQSLETGC